MGPCATKAKNSAGKAKIYCKDRRKYGDHVIKDAQCAYISLPSHEQISSSFNPHIVVALSHTNLLYLLSVYWSP